jgi:hypothetical protein
MSQLSTGASDENRARFFDAARAAFDSAQSKTATNATRFFRIGGYAIRLHFAGNALAPRLTPALEHLSCAPTTPDLSIFLWDSASTQTEMTPPPWSHDDYGVHGEIRGYNCARFRTAFNLGSGVLSALDLEKNEALFWIRNAADLPIYESGAPLLTTLHWWMSANARQLIHAAAIGKKEAGVLLVGKGGSGKSSTALRALNSDLQYAADDYCLLQGGENPFVHSLYSSGKIHSRDAHKFPFLQPALDSSTNLNNEKALFFLHETFGEKISAGFPIRAVLCPTVMDRETTTLRKIPASSSLLALAPSTIFQLPGSGQNNFSFISEIVRRVPGYALELGRDYDNIPRVIADFLETME